MKDIKSTLIKYLLTVIFGGVIVAIALIARDFGSLLLIADKYRALADAFTIPGVVILMAGVIIIIAKDGFFDIITYGLGRLGKSLIPFSKKTDEHFYDYKVRKASERTGKTGFLFVVGAVFLSVGIIFTILFCTV